MGIANLLGGICVLMLGALATFFASRLDYQAEYGPGPGFLPLWIGSALIFFGGLTVLRALRAHGHPKGSFFQTNTRKVVFLFFTLVVTFFLVPALGLTSGLSLFTGFTMRTAGRHRWLTCILVTITTGVGIYGIFGHALGIPLLKGIFGF